LSDLTREAVRQGVAPFGPVSVAPGDGSLAVTNTAGQEVFGFTEGGARVYHRGATKLLNPLLEGTSDTLDTHDGRITTAQDTATNARGRADAAYTRGEDAWDRAGRALADAATAQGAADSAATAASDAWGRAGQALADAATAQS